MPASMMANAKDEVRRNGYKLLARVLTELVKRGQYQIAAMIIIAICLLDRNTEEHNNGVIAILTHEKLHEVASGDLRHAINDAVRRLFYAHHDQIMVTLLTCGWYQGAFAFNRQQPMLMRNDDMWLFTPATDGEDRNVQLCGATGPQNLRCLAETRILKRDDALVEVYSRQMGEYPSAAAGRIAVGNGYFKYLLPANTIVYRFGRDQSGRTLGSVLPVGQWCNYYLRPADAPDLGGGAQ